MTNIHFKGIHGALLRAGLGISFVEEGKDSFPTVAGTVGFRFCVDAFTSQLESVPGDTVDTLVSPCSRPAPNVPFPRSPCHSRELNWHSLGQNPEQSLARVSPPGGVNGTSRQEPLFLLRLEALLRPF